MSAIEPVSRHALLDRDSAERLTNEVIDRLTRAGALLQETRPILLEIYQGQAWLALGFQNYVEYAAHYFSDVQGFASSPATIYRQLKAGMIESQINVPPGTLPVRALEPLDELPVEERAAVWQAACATWSAARGKGYPSASWVRATAETLAEAAATQGLVTVNDGQQVALTAAIAQTDAEAIMSKWRSTQDKNVPIFKGDFTSAQEAAAALAKVDTGGKRFKVLIYAVD